MTTRYISGGRGNLPYSSRVLVNASSEVYEIEAGYSTTANGSASAIVCPSGGYAIKVVKGGPRDFSCWLIADDFSEIDAHMREYPDWFDNYLAIKVDSEEPEAVNFSRALRENVLQVRRPSEDGRIPGEVYIRQAIRLYEQGYLPAQS